MNKCHFMGNLVRDPELVTLKNGSTKVRFTLAINRRYKKGDEYVNDPSFIDCEAWDSGAEVIKKYFSKGSPILVHCSVFQNRFETKDGQKRTNTLFRVSEFEFVNSKRKDSNSGGGQDETVSATVSDSDSDSDSGEYDGDIPF
jgi:single-strand DNA-binding protein